MAKHTKLPWKASKMGGCKEIRGNKSGPHRQAQYLTEIAWTPGLFNEEEDRANADFIIESCNNHYKKIRLLITAENILRELCEEPGSKSLASLRDHADEIHYFIKELKFVDENIT